jgi:hypothetical protein
MVVWVALLAAGRQPSAQHPKLGFATPVALRKNWVGRRRRGEAACALPALAPSRAAANAINRFEVSLSQSCPFHSGKSKALPLSRSVASQILDLDLPRPNPALARPRSLTKRL